MKEEEAAGGGGGALLEGGVPPPPQSSAFNSIRRHVRNPNTTHPRFQSPVTAPATDFAARPNRFVTALSLPPERPPSSSKPLRGGGGGVAGSSCGIQPFSQGMLRGQNTRRRGGGFCFAQRPTKGLVPKIGLKFPAPLIKFICASGQLF